jgi:hypothetical protein
MADYGVKKKKKKGKKGINYYGKADGYDPSKQDGDTWSDGGSSDSNGGGAFSGYKSGTVSPKSSGSRTKPLVSKPVVSKPVVSKPKPKPKPGGGRRP